LGTVIDSHCHVLPAGFQDRRADLLARDATFATLFRSPKAKIADADLLVAAMDGAGVDRAVVMGIGWVDRRIAEEANDYIIASVQRYPDRLMGFCSVNPAWGDAAAEEISRCAKAGLVGIGELHPDTQGFDLTDRHAMEPIMHMALELALPVLVHGSEPVGHKYSGKGQTTPEVLYRFVENFPKNKIILAHWGGGLPFYGLMPEVAQALENVYFDSAASPFLYDPQVFTTVAALVGADKVMFASDYPLLSLSRALKDVETSGLDAGAREAVLGGTAARLLGL